MSLAMFMAVGAGGALGAMSRYGVAQLVGGGLFGIAGPMATLVVNVAGSSLMGAIAAGIIDAAGNVPFLRAVHPHERPEMTTVYNSFRGVAQTAP
ncbi:MAG: CrcB family protein, partial [Candidatus Puniceispirillaceae bacterium]